MATPASAVRGVLAAALPTEDVRTGTEQQDGDRGIWVSQAGGLPPIQVAGVAEAVEQYRVRVFCRVGPRDHDELETLVESARSAVSRTAPTGYAVSNPTPAAEQAPDQYGRAAASFRVALTIIE